MNWTTEKPTAPGWYWFREILHDQSGTRTPGVVGEIIERQGHFFFLRREHYLEPNVNELNGEFAGPIPRPVDLTRIVACPKCGGGGKIAEKYEGVQAWQNVTCPECHGTGVKEIPV